MVDLNLLTKLRNQTGAGVSDCKKALDEANGDYEKSIEVLRKRGEAKAAKKCAEREVKEGIIYAYIHSNNKAGAMLELDCETDFVAKNEEFQKLAHDFGMQIVAMSPEYVKPEDVPAEIIEKEKEIYRVQLEKEGKPAEIIEKILEGKIAKYYEEVCLLKQSFIKDDSKKMEDVLNEAIAKTGEKMELRRFTRYQI